MRRSPAILCLLFCLAIAPIADGKDLPSAFDLLAKVRETYAVLDAYSDLGEMEIITGPPGEERTTLSFFELATTEDGGLFWRTHGPTEAGFEERVVWTDGTHTFVYRSLLDQYKQVPSLIAELAHRPGPGVYDALIVPLLLAGDSEVLEDPPAASVDGEQPCGAGTCWLVSLSRMAGTIESELWVDQSTLLIHEVNVHRHGGASPLTEPASQAPLRPISGSSSIRIRHHPSLAAARSFKPPVGAQLVSQWQVRPAAADPVSATESLNGAVFGEEITVTLMTVVARIVDSRGEPIRSLKPGDLIARAGSVEIPIQAIEWSSSEPRPRVQPDRNLDSRLPSLRVAESRSADVERPIGRRIVFFLQINLEPSRIAGNLKVMPDIERLLKGLNPDDRVAIVSFDSHLKLWLDFTADRQTAFEVLRRATSYGRPKARRGRGVSLLEHFDRQAAAEVATPEKALEFTAQALAHLPGEKDMIFLGWGLGRYGAGGVRMTAQYRPAVRALTAARTTVFVLDVSQADYHSLEVGLQNVAAHTGGTYERTLHFASQAVKRLARTIGGHYVVTLDRSAVPGAKGLLNLHLREKKGRVLFKPVNLG